MRRYQATTGLVFVTRGTRYEVAAHKFVNSPRLFESLVALHPSKVIEVSMREDELKRQLNYLESYASTQSFSSFAVSSTTTSSSLQQAQQSDIITHANFAADILREPAYLNALFNWVQQNVLKPLNVIIYLSHVYLRIKRSSPSEQQQAGIGNNSSTTLKTLDTGAGYSQLNPTPNASSIQTTSQDSPEIQKCYFSMLSACVGLISQSLESGCSELLADLESVHERIQDEILEKYLKQKSASTGTAISLPVQSISQVAQLMMQIKRRSSPLELMLTRQKLISSRPCVGKDFSNISWVIDESKSNKESTVFSFKQFRMQLLQREEKGELGIYMRLVPPESQLLLHGTIVSFYFCVEMTFTAAAAAATGSKGSTSSTATSNGATVTTSKVRLDHFIVGQNLLIQLLKRKFVEQNTKINLVVYLTHDLIYSTLAQYSASQAPSVLAASPALPLICFNDIKAIINSMSVSLLGVSSANDKFIVLQAWLKYVNKAQLMVAPANNGSGSVDRQIENSDIPDFIMSLKLGTSNQSNLLELLKSRNESRTSNPSNNNNNNNENNNNSNTYSTKNAFSSPLRVPPHSQQFQFEKSSLTEVKGSYGISNTANTSREKSDRLFSATGSLASATIGSQSKSMKQAETSSRFLESIGFAGAGTQRPFSGYLPVKNPESAASLHSSMSFKVERVANIASGQGATTSATTKSPTPSVHVNFNSTSSSQQQWNSVNNPTESSLNDQYSTRTRENGQQSSLLQPSQQQSASQTGGINQLKKPPLQAASSSLKSYDLKRMMSPQIVSRSNLYNPIVSKNAHNDPLLASPVSSSVNWKSQQQINGRESDRIVPSTTRNSQHAINEYYSGPQDRRQSQQQQQQQQQQSTMNSFNSQVMNSLNENLSLMNIKLQEETEENGGGNGSTTGTGTAAGVGSRRISPCPSQTSIPVRSDSSRKITTISKTGGFLHPSSAVTSPLARKYLSNYQFKSDNKGEEHSINTLASQKSMQGFLGVKEWSTDNNGQGGVGTQDRTIRTAQDLGRYDSVGLQSRTGSTAAAAGIGATSTGTSLGFGSPSGAIKGNQLKQQGSGQSGTDRNSSQILELERKFIEPEDSSKERESLFLKNEQTSATTLTSLSTVRLNSAADLTSPTYSNRKERNEILPTQLLRIQSSPAQNGQKSIANSSGIYSVRGKDSQVFEPKETYKLEEPEIIPSLPKHLQAAKDARKSSVLAEINLSSFICSNSLKSAFTTV